MYTRCPHCLTVFVVGAEQLKAAHGNVRCGTCLESFDAIPHLSDGPLQPPAGAGHVEVDDDAAVPDTRSASAQLSSTLDVVRAATALDGLGENELASARTADATTGEGASVADLDDSVEPRKAPADRPSSSDDDEHRGTSDTGNRVSVLNERSAQALPPLPAVLREESDAIAARTAARRRNIGYGLAALALLGLLAVQYVFFMPEDAARRYPQWRGGIESLCVKLGCVLPERRDPTRIRVLSRDVRLHPRYEGVLQIKATLSNAAPFRQPYPRVRFTLFNVNGQTIATRVFQPSEYLGRKVAASARLRPQTPFQVALDVLAPEEAAVSFEFQFL